MFSMLSQEVDAGPERWAGFSLVQEKCFLNTAESPIFICFVPTRSAENLSCPEILCSPLAQTTRRRRRKNPSLLDCWHTSRRWNRKLCHVTKGRRKQSPQGRGRAAPLGGCPDARGRMRGLAVIVECINYMDNTFEEVKRLAHWQKVRTALASGPVKRLVKAPKARKPAKIGGPLGEKPEL